jgi:flagellum-specific ATP synthase
MTQITPPEQQQLAQRFRSFSATYDQNRDLISVGAYVAGSDPRIDAAIAAYPALRGFIQQGLDAHFSLAESTQALEALTPYLAAEGSAP